MIDGILGFLFGSIGKPTVKVESETYNLEADVILSEVHEWRNEVTTNPVEEGSPIADHIIVMPDRLTFSGFVSDTPIKGIIGLGIFDTDEDSAKYFFEALDLLRENGEIITVYTKYKTYEDMVITSITIPREIKTGEAIEFTMEFIHVRIVETQTTELPAGVGVGKDGKAAGADSEVTNRSSPATNNGKTEGAATSAGSVLDGIGGVADGIRDFVGGLIGG